MPEAGVHKYGDALAAENEIGLFENGRVPPPAGDAMLAHQRDETECSVARFPHERMSAMTALRFALVKTSAIGARTVVGGDLETARGFVVLVRVHPVVEAGPLGVAGIEFFVGEFACVRAPPRLGGEAFQHVRPPAPSVLVAVGMQAGEGVRDSAPCSEEVGLSELFKLRGERAAWKPEGLHRN